MFNFATILKDNEIDDTIRHRVEVGNNSGYLDEEY